MLIALSKARKGNYDWCGISARGDGSIHHWWVEYHINPTEWVSWVLEANGIGNNEALVIDILFPKDPDDDSVSLPTKPS